MTVAPEDLTSKTTKEVFFSLSASFSNSKRESKTKSSSLKKSKKNAGFLQVFRTENFSSKWIQHHQKVRQEKGPWPRHLTEISFHFLPRSSFLFGPLCYGPQLPGRMLTRFQKQAAKASKTKRRQKNPRPLFLRRPRGSSLPPVPLNLEYNQKQTSETLVPQYPQIKVLQNPVFLQVSHLTGAP